MTPAKYPLEPFTAGDRWKGIPALSITVGGAIPASPISVVTLRFRRSGEAAGTVVELVSPTNITLTNAANWQFAIPPQAVAALTAGTWEWQLRITAVDGAKDTYLADELTVFESI